MDYADIQKMSDDDLAKRIFEGAPGSDWWESLKFELDKRNTLRFESSMSRVESSLEKAGHFLSEMGASAVRTERSTKRLEVATWIILAASVVIALDALLRLVQGH